MAWYEQWTVYSPNQEVINSISSITERLKTSAVTSCGNHASNLVPLSIATKGNHLDRDCGKVCICGIHIGIDRYLVATFRTADRLLRYIPTI